MALVIGLGVRGAKSAYRAYKKHQANKDNHAQDPSVPPYTVTDPSEELGYYYSTAQYPSQQQTGYIEHPSQQQLGRRRRDSSTSSASSAEVEAQLENDVEFQRFIRRQKQMYLEQKRQQEMHDARLAGNNMPPSYDHAIAHQGPARTPQHMQYQARPRAAELSDEEVSPVMPTNLYRRSKYSERGGSPVSAPGSPFSDANEVRVCVPRPSSSSYSSIVDGATELPGAPRASSARHPVELPAAIP